MVTKYGIMVDPSKIVVIRDCARPTTFPTEVYRFLGFAGYYHNFVEGSLVYYGSFNQVGSEKSGFWVVGCMWEELLKSQRVVNFWSYLDFA